MIVYRSHQLDQDIADARATVEDHRLDPATGRCRVCETSAPCAAANQAVNVLAAMGALDTTTGSVLDRSGGGLLTHGWRVVFGLVARPSAASTSVRPGGRRP